MDIIPRENLTKKARAAISTYALIRKDSKRLNHEMLVDFILKAERMRRSELYQYLDGKGYIWRSQENRWDLKKR